MALLSFFKFVEIGFVIVLVIVVPALSYRTSQRLDLLVLPRLNLYWSAALSQWLLTSLGVLVVLITPVTFAEAGLRTVSATSFLFWTAVLAGVSLAALGLVVLLERWGWFPPEPDLVYALIPETRKEKLWAVLMIAPTAGLCEEFLYRGVLLALLSQWLFSAAWAAAISSVAFGLAHVYQGASGIVRAALLGALLSIPVVRLGTILPSTAAHCLIDAVALAWLGPKMLRKGSQ
jgi:membrane protease YdiL (CAAX protease family)